MLAPIIPVSYEDYGIGVVEFKYEKTNAELLTVPSTAQDINITNKDIFGGTFSVLMTWTPNEVEGVPAVGYNHTESWYIQPNSTHTFKVPKDWKFTGPLYDYEVYIDAPTILGNVSTIKTEYKSVIRMILN
jgi:hypothetical protein